MVPDPYRLINYFPFSKDKIEVIYHGIDEGLFNTSKDLSMAKKVLTKYELEITGERKTRVYRIKNR